MLLPIMLKGGINVVGVVDANRKGVIECAGRTFPIYSIEQAAEAFGADFADFTVIVTIANAEILPGIVRNLAAAGVRGDRIYDCNVLSWITVPSEKSYCHEHRRHMQLFGHAFSMCCTPGVVAVYDAEYLMTGKPLAESLESWLSKRDYYIRQSQNGKIPLCCAGCGFLTETPADCSDKISRIGFTCHNICNSDCVYCTDKVSSDSKKRLFDIGELTEFFAAVVDRFAEDGLMADGTVVSIAGGEITVNPQRQCLYDMCSKHPAYRYDIFSNCFIFDERIADILAQSEDNCLMCDLDAGTPETYVAVKGFNKFDIAVENLRKYARRGKVQLKYIIIPGINDSDADFDGTVRVLKYIGLDTLWLYTDYDILTRNDCTLLRKTAFGLARFMLALDEHGIRHELGFFSSKQEALILRLYGELKTVRKGTAAGQGPVKQ